MTSFSDYYAQEKSKLASDLNPKLPKVNLGPAPAAPNPIMGALGWLGDIISRPLYGVTNAVSDAINSGVQAGTAIAKGEGIGGALGQQFHENPLGGAGSFLSGMFSTDPKLHRSTSDVIEQTSDKLGPVINPAYKDVANNVNPVVKGIAGFAGDIALDPLTYVPGGVILKAFKSLAPAAKAVKDITKSSKVADEAATLATKMKAPTKETAVNAVISKLNNEALGPQVAGLADAALPPTEAVTKYMRDIRDPNVVQHLKTNELVTGQKLALSNRNVSKALKTPKAASALEALQGFGSQGVKDLAHAVSNVKDAQPLGDYYKWLGEVEKIVPTLKKGDKIPTIRIKNTSVPLTKVLEQTGSLDKAVAGNAAVQLQKFYVNGYRGAFERAKQGGKLIDALGREVKPISPEATAGSTIKNAMQGFAFRKQYDQENLIGQIGQPLFDVLQKYSNPQKFDDAVSKMSSILDGSVNVHTLKTLSSPQRRMLQHIGVEPDSLPLGAMRKTQPVRNEFKPPQYTPDLVPDPALYTKAEQDAISKMGQGLDQPQLIANRVLQDVIPHEYGRVLDPASDFTHVSAKGALRTATALGEGEGRWLREFNGGSFYTVHTALMKQVSRLLKGSSLGGPTYAQAVKDIYMPALRLVERKLDADGVPMFVGAGDDRVAISLSQILDTLNQADPAGMNRYFWNAGTNVPETNLTDAVAAAVSGKHDFPVGDTNVMETVTGPEAITRALTQSRAKYVDASGGGNFENHLVTGGRYGNTVVPGAKLVDGLSNLIANNAGKFQAIAEDNAKASMQRFGEEVHYLTDGELHDLATQWQSAAGFGDLIRAVNDISPRLRNEAENIGAQQAAVDTAYHGVEATIDPHESFAVKSWNRQEKAIGSATAKRKDAFGRRIQPGAKSLADETREIERVNAEEAQKRFNDVYSQTMQDIADETPMNMNGATRDLGQTIQQAQNVGLFSTIRTVFDTSFGNKLLRDDVRKMETGLSTAVRAYLHDLSGIQKAFSGPGDDQILARAYANIQRDVVDTDPRVAQAQEMLKPSVFQVWGGGPEGKSALLDNAFTRSGISLDDANRVLTHTKLGEQYLFDEDQALQDMQKLGISKPEALARQWRTHQVDDPINYLAQVYGGFAAAASRQTLANSFMRMAEDLGALSKSPRAGYVRFVDPERKSVMARYLPDDIYIKDDAARQMNVVDSMMRDVSDHSSPIWKFLDNYYIPTLDLWKWGNTLPNPTHQIRNFVGDTALTFLRNGTKGYLKAHRTALQAMATHNAYDGYDFVKALQGVNELPNAGKVLYDGKLGRITANDAYRAAMDRGNMPTFQQAEQLETNLQGTSAVANTWKKLTDSKVGRKIGGISEARDHYVRMVHFLQYVDQGINNTRKYPDLNALLDAASTDTRKWHPDGSDMTKSEKVIKLAIPFYAWTRKAIPLVVESYLTHPARVNAFNKASYNLAVSMGVNPHSLSDPFPDDQVFPSYLTDQSSGPQFKINGKYFGIEPGIPTWDVLNSTIAGNPLQNVLGQLAPMIKAPFEVATGTNLGTGSPIHDWSDYVDSQIPGIAQAARLTGVSPTGSVYGLLSGQGPQQQYQVAKGNKQPLVSILNYLTGAGITPMSEGNQISYAQIQRQNTARGSGVGF